MNISPRRMIFRREKPHSNPYRMMVWVALILIGFMVYRGTQQGTIRPLLYPTATPTRSTSSFEDEANTYFQIGNMDAAIASYQKALALKPDVADLYTRMARIQAYSSESLTTDQDKLNRMKEAIDSADQAIKLAPDDSSAHAVRAFVLDWYAGNALLSTDDRAAALAQAETEASQSMHLDEQNVEALAFTAEIYIDQGKWVQAEQTIAQAMSRDPNNIDVRRVHALVLENMGDYDNALAEYEKTVEMAPNLTFLYIRVGALYRHRAQVLNSDYSDASNQDKAKVIFNQALDIFTTAAEKNEQLGIKDPLPYTAIANTYADMGEFFAAMRNARKAVVLNPTTPLVYAQLGLIYDKARNYESSIEAFHCAIDGCTPAESCKVRDDCDAPVGTITVEPLALTNTTLMYYYTYGSVLSALNKPGQDYCTTAMKVFTTIRAFPNVDTQTLRIVSVGESICTAAQTGVTATPGAGTPVATSGTGTAHPSKAPTSTPTPSRTPTPRRTPTPTRTPAP